MLKTVKNIFEVILATIMLIVIVLVVIGCVKTGTALTGNVPQMLMKGAAAVAGYIGYDLGVIK